MLKSTLFLLLLTLSTKSFADDNVSHPNEWHCITDHLNDAIKLNSERRSLYATLTDERSTALSDELIASERSILNSLRPTLPLLNTYWALGIPVLCREFAPMTEAPAFSETYSTPLPEGKVEFANPSAIILKLSFAQLRRGQKGLIEEGRKQIRGLDKADHYQCMMKHVLESIVFSAEVLAEVKKDASGAPIKLPTEWISNLSIETQKISLMTASKIDKKAEEIHRQGIPIICNDVPRILHDL